MAKITPKKYPTVLLKHLEIPLNQSLMLANRNHEVISTTKNFSLATAGLVWHGVFVSYNYHYNSSGVGKKTDRRIDRQTHRHTDTQTYMERQARGRCTERSQSRQGPCKEDPCEK